MIKDLKLRHEYIKNLYHKMDQSDINEKTELLQKIIPIIHKFEEKKAAFGFSS